MCKTLWGEPPLACGHIAISAISLYMFRYKYIVHLVLIYNGCLWLQSEHAHLWWTYVQTDRQNLCVSH